MAWYGMVYFSSSMKAESFLKYLTFSTSMTEFSLNCLVLIFLFLIINVKKGRTTVVV